jgi:hypothetical protein
MHPDGSEEVEVLARQRKRRPRFWLTHVAKPKHPARCLVFSDACRSSAAAAALNGYRHANDEDGDEKYARAGEL